VKVRIPNRGSYGDSGGRLMMHGFKAHLQAWLAEYAVAPPIRNLAELIAFNKAHAAREMALFGQEVLEHIERHPLLSPAAVREARTTLHRLAGTEGLDAVMKLDRLDALIGITSVPGWHADPARRPRPDPGFTTPAAAAGYPHVTVPAGHAGLLPVGLSFVGTAWSEPQLMAMAHDFELAAQAWRQPSFAAAQG
ncbi:MAG: amidase, partial [Roseateles sp.]